MMKIKDGEFGSFVAMVVRDDKVMLDFYQNVLGMELLGTDTGDKDVAKHYLKFKGGMLKMFVPSNPPEISTPDFMGSTGYRLQTYMVANMTNLFKALEEKEVRIVTPIQSNADGSKWGVIVDPEGNPIEFSGEG
jgi:uncharacterized glyoxalase superfamily protein PhnB